MNFRQGLLATLLIAACLPAILSGQNYTISSVAGDPFGPVTGSGSGLAVNIIKPAGVALDSAGNVYIADGESAVYKLTPAGILSTVAGTPALLRVIPATAAKRRMLC